MIISSTLYDKIFRNLSEEPVESGGILGGTGNTVTAVEPDDGAPSPHRCMYIPNVKMMNETIQNWGKEQINFLGMYHSHFNNVASLSASDKHYIHTILKAMPETVEYLYFPVALLPSRRLICYKAFLTEECLTITEEETTIIQDAGTE